LYLQTITEIIKEKEKKMSDKVYPWDMINGSPRVSAELVEERLSICSTCPAFRPLTQTCKKCGCFMKMKTQLEKAYCPLGKW
jgi:hypothetical protein